MSITNGQHQRERVEVGDGLLEIVLGDKTATVDPVAWVRWHEDWKPPENAGPWAMHDDARAKLKAETGTELNATQIDAFLHAVLEWFGRLKKKQRATLGLPSSTESAPSE